MLAFHFKIDSEVRRAKKSVDCKRGGLAPNRVAEMMTGGELARSDRDRAGSTQPPCPGRAGMMSGDWSQRLAQLPSRPPTSCPHGWAHLASCRAGQPHIYLRPGAPLAPVPSSAQEKTPRVVLGTVHESLVTLIPAPQNVLNWTSVWAQSIPPSPLHADHQLTFLNAHYKMSLFSSENPWGSAVSAC